ncbi:glycosyltransferase family 4 protein [Vibrio diabolicus]|uniref:glycosyltransferase family 4 protein n=1 Tax=Vibrio diabolicus TaxID=50719 RepID=UPI00211AA6B5|nr:glycosyltransferase family 4 protein [Vibrio diabolicus]
MKVVAFVGETFQQYENQCFTKPTSVAFLQDTFGEGNVYAASSAINVSERPTSYSTKVQGEKFYAFPSYDSTKSFLVRSLLSKGFLKSYIQKSDEIIAKHQGDLFWIRTPSIGSIVFGLRVLKHEQTLLHHMCADASNTWKDAKYKGVSKLLAFITSRFLRVLLKKICGHPKTINFCTGDVLERFSKQYSSNTFQFVDVMIKSVDTSNFSRTKRKDNRKKLLFVGRMVEDKGIFDLIDALDELKENYTLTFVGDGPDFSKAKQTVAQKKLDDTIQFTGQLPHSALAELFYSTDLVVVPSNNNYEGFPRVIMEAWSFNKPVIVSNVGGINAFVKNNENGLIIGPGNVSELKQALMACRDDSCYQELCIGARGMANKSLQSYWINLLKKKVISAHVTS